MLIELAAALHLTACVPDVSGGNPDGVWCGRPDHVVSIPFGRVSTNEWHCLIMSGYHSSGNVINAPASEAQRCSGVPVGYVPTVPPPGSTQAPNPPERP